MSSVREDTFSLKDRYDAVGGEVLVTGIQALARAPMDQIRADRARGWKTAAFISGYQGSPLGGYDRELLSNQKLLDEFGIVLRPGINEELAATSVAGSQLVSTRPNANVEGVVGVWYGKAPGLERAADAIRHANFVGTAPRGGVLALIGDDPACKSSTVPSRSDSMAAALGIALLEPGTMQDILDLARHGIEMSRASGLWVGLKIVTQIADGTGTANVDPTRIAPAIPQLEHQGKLWTPTLSGFVIAPQSLEQEVEISGPRTDMARAYIRANQLNVETISSPSAWLGIVASGQIAEVVLEALKVLGLDEVRAGALGIRLLKLRGVLPFDTEAVREVARGVRTLLVVEEKRPFLETLVRDALYGSADHPAVVGKRDATGAVLDTDAGSLTVDTLVEPLRRVLLQNISAERIARPRHRIALSLAVNADANRTAYFCSGCPHNTSTLVPEGALVGVGIGCHGMVRGASTGNRGDFTGMTQMGGEGTHWIGMAPFVDTPHMFQNLGDGTFFHSGQLAVQAAKDAGVNITYKILYNAAVAMTGGQDATGLLTVLQVAEKLVAEGVTEVVITTDEPEKYKGVTLPRNTTVRHRDDIIAVQERLQTIPGVTILIHDQQCAAEKRRDRKRGLLPTPTKKVVIDHRVCEGCGDCGQQSNCLSLEPIDTEFGRKTKIDQASCNLDQTCLKGDCPAFVTVVPSKKPRTTPDPLSLGALPDPAMVVPAEGVTMRMPGIGGTGVVTVSQMLLTAAKIDGIHASAVDQTGLSQKAGPVVSTLTIGDAAPGQVHLLLGFDLIASTMSHNVQGLDPAWSHIIASSHITPTGNMIGRVATASLETVPFTRELEKLSRGTSNLFPDVTALANGLLGSAVTANTLLLGVAFQAGTIPLSAAAIERAIELNGAAVKANLAAFRWGRQWVAKRAAVERLAAGPVEKPADRSGLEDLGSDALTDLVARRRDDLRAYQDAAYANRYVAHVRRVQVAEVAAGGDGCFTSTVAHQLHHLMAYKDEYEVARLLVGSKERVEWALGGEVESMTFHLHPPTLRSMGMKNKLRFSDKTKPGFAALAAMKRLRGTKADIFGRAAIRKEERLLIDEYVALVDLLLPVLATKHDEAARIVGLVDQVRGFEEVKMRNLTAYRAAVAEALAAI